jgi:4-amino-4-deoxy-L-arabinose transferase-like glycosyltransferase
MERIKQHCPIIVLTVLAGALPFANLGNQYLWQDEAETALLGRRVLEYGYPRAYDGKNLINPTIRTSFSEDYGWRYHPWGQFYITAAAFRMFGESNFSARVLFALMGLLNIPLLYVLALRLTRERSTALIASVLTVFSVNYLLLMRQARYYAPAVFLVLIALIFYSRYLERRKPRDILSVYMALTALGYTVHGMFVPVFAAICLHYFIFGFDRKSFQVFLIFAGITAASVVPWFLYSNSGAHVAAITAKRLWQNFEFQARMINKFIMPVFFFLCIYAARGSWKRRWKIELTGGEKRAVRLILPVIVVSMGAFLFAEERNFRYLVYFIPLLAIAQGMILLRLFRFNKALFAAFLALTVLTGVFNMGRFEFYFPKYLYEITHDYDGPIEGIVKFLEANAREGDEVKIIYGDIPVMFYTDLKVDNSGIYNDQHMPEWIVFRKDWGESLASPYYRKVQAAYRKHVLDYPDIKWENRPDDMGFHKFRTVKNAPRVLVFEKTAEMGK